MRVSLPKRRIKRIFRKNDICFRSEVKRGEKKRLVYFTGLSLAPF